MDWYTPLKLVHVLSAIVGVGTNLTYFYWLRAAQQPGPDTPAILHGVTMLDRLANVGYTLLPITGVAMVLVGPYEFSTLWVAIAIALFITVGAVAGIVFTPSLRRQVALAGEAGTEPATYAAVARRTMVSGTASMILVAAIITLMVTKPS